MQVRSLQGDTIDQLCFRYYGRTQGVVEAVLAANPGLSALGVLLPHGTVVTLPELSHTTGNKTVINLWD